MDFYQILDFWFVFKLTFISYIRKIVDTFLLLTCVIFFQMNILFSLLFKLNKIDIIIATLGYVTECKISTSYNTCMSEIYTVGENIIATTKIRNNYVALQSFIFPLLRQQYWTFLYCSL